MSPHSTDLTIPPTQPPQHTAVGSRQPKRRGHITRVTTLYFTPPGHPIITAVDARYAYHVQTDEPPYGNSRTILVGEQWQPLDLGWCKDCGVSLISIHNLEGKWEQVMPTEDERREAMKKIIEVAVPFPELSEEQRHAHNLPKEKTSPPPFPLQIIRPQRESNFEPYVADTIQVRCRSGQAKARIVVFPL